MLTILIVANRMLWDALVAAIKNHAAFIGTEFNFKYAADLERAMAVASTLAPEDGILVSSQVPFHENGVASPLASVLLECYAERFITAIARFDGPEDLGNFKQEHVVEAIAKPLQHLAKQMTLQEPQLTT